MKWEKISSIFHLFHHFVWSFDLSQGVITCNLMWSFVIFFDRCDLFWSFAIICQFPPLDLSDTFPSFRDKTITQIEVPLYFIIYWKMWLQDLDSRYKPWDKPLWLRRLVCWTRTKPIQRAFNKLFIASQLFLEIIYNTSMTL